MTTKDNFQLNFVNINLIFYSNFLDRLKFSKSHGYSKQEVDKDDKGLLICATCNTAVNLFVYSMENVSEFMLSF